MRPLAIAVDRWKRRLVAVRCILALTFMIAASLLVVAVLLAVDRTCHLSELTRTLGAFAVCLAAVATCLGVGRWLLKPSRWKALATRIQQTQSALAGELVSAVEFLSTQDSHGSAELREVVIRRVESRLQTERWRDLLADLAWWKPIAFLAISASIFLGAAHSLSDLRMGWQRWTHPFDAGDWPRKNRFQWMDADRQPISQSQITAPEGTGLTLFVASTSGRIPQTARVRVRVMDSAGSRESGASSEFRPRRVPEERGTSEVGEISLVDLHGRTILEVDDPREDFGKITLVIETEVPPRIMKFTATVTPPSYVHEPPKTITGTQVRGISGSQVRLDFESDREVSRMLVDRGDQSDSQDLLKDLPREASRREFALEFPLGSPGLSTLTLTPVAATENRGRPLRLELSSLADLAPQVNLQRPSEDRTVTPHAEFPVLAQVQDDVGLRAVRLRMMLESSPTDSIPETMIERTIAEGMEFSFQESCDLRKLSVVPGQTWKIWIEAADGAALAGASVRWNAGPVRRLTVVTPTEKIEELGRSLRQASQRLAQDLESARALRDASQAIEPKLPVAAEPLRRIRHGQQELSDDLLDPHRGLRELCERLQREWKENRLEENSPHDDLSRRLDRLIGDLTQLQQGPLQQISAILRELTSSAELASSPWTRLDVAQLNQVQRLEALTELTADWNQQEERRLSAIVTLNEQRRLLKETEAWATAAGSSSHTDRAKLAQQQADLVRRLEKAGLDGSEEVDMAEVLQPMRDAAEFLRQSQTDQAIYSQQITIAALEETLQSEPPVTILRKRCQAALTETDAILVGQQETQQLSREITNSSDSSVKQRREALARRERDLADRTAFLAKRARKLGWHRAADAFTNSTEDLRRSSDRLENPRTPVPDGSESPTELDRQQADAVTELKIAQAELKRVQLALASQQASQTLTDLLRKVRGLSLKQTSVWEETKRLEILRQSAGRLTRSQTKTLQLTERTQSELAERTRETGLDLAEHPVFENVLSQAAQAMTQAAAELADQHTGESVTAAQESANRLLQNLIAVIASDDAPSASTSSNESDPPDKRSTDAGRIIWAAEWRLLRMIQSGVSERTEALTNAHESASTTAESRRDLQTEQSQVMTAAKTLTASLQPDPRIVEAAVECLRLMERAEWGTSLSESQQLVLRRIDDLLQNDRNVASSSPPHLDDSSSHENSEQQGSPNSGTGATQGLKTSVPNAAIFDPLTEHKLAKGVWGHLPPEEREQLKQRMSARFPQRYEALLRRYYQTLAEYPAAP